MQWMPDETALAKTGEIAPEQIPEYEKLLAFDPSEELRLLEDLGLSAAETIVEFGPGPGAFVVAAAQIAERVIAVEPSPALCRHITDRCETLSLANVTVVNAGFLSYQHTGPPVGFVFSKNALHHLSDFWKMEAIRRIAGIVRPGGTLRLRDLVFSFEPDDAADRIAEWVASYSGSSGWSEAALHDHVRAEYSTYNWIIEHMLDTAGFDIADRWTSDSEVFARYTCIRR